MLTRGQIRSVGLVMLLLTAFVPVADRAAAADVADVLDFLKNTACSRIPVKGCDVLDAENAENIYKAARYFISQKFCETPNLKQAERLLEIDPLAFPDPESCRRLVEVDKALNARPEEPAGKAPPSVTDRSAPEPGGTPARGHDANPSLCRILKTCN